jgi:hypothetical protein
MESIIITSMKSMLYNLAMSWTRDCHNPEVKGKAIPVQAMEALRGVRGWGSHIFRHSAHRWRQGCQPYAPAAFYPQENSSYSFLLRGRVDPKVMMQLEGLGKLKKSTSSRTRTGDLPACSIVPQPTTLPRAPTITQGTILFIVTIVKASRPTFQWNPYRHLAISVLSQYPVSQNLHLLH